VWIGLAGAICAIAYGILAWASHALRPLPIAVFFAVFGAATVVWIIVWRRAALSDLRTCVAFALLFRLIGFFGAPIYEDDFYRYLWDGFVFATQGNPYGVAPAAYFGSDSLPPKFDEILGQINYPDIPTIYGPVCEIAFLAGYLVAPGQLWPLKVFFLTADLAILLFLWRWTRSIEAIVLYGWAPLVIKEVSFTAHPDVLAALFSVLAIWRRNALWLGLAVGAKVQAVVMLFWVLKRKDWRGLTLFLATVGAIYAPFLLQGRSDLTGLAAFASEWEFNSFAFAVLRVAFGEGTARVVSPLIFVSGVAALWCWKRPLFRPDVVLMLLFLFSPVVNPWYLLLAAPFIAIQPSWWGVTALATILISYGTGLNFGRDDIGQFDHPWWVRPLEAIPVLLAAAQESYRQRRMTT
jgi:alpha-1,6-mannosyltransferase